MATLSPNVDFQVQAEAPVSQPSAMQGLAALVESAADVLTIQNRRQSSSGGIQQSALDNALVEGLRRVQALEDAGRTAEARQMERRIAINYTRDGGDFASSRTKELVQSFTGRPPEHFGFSEDEIAEQRILESPEFTQAYIATRATHPDASDEERVSIAMSTLAKKEANAAIIAESEYEWNSQTQAAFSGLISDFKATLLGGLALVGDQGGTFSREDVQQARLQLQAFKAQITAQRPSGLGAEEWKPIEDQLASVDNMLQYWEEISGPDNMAANAAAALMREVENLDITEPKKNILLRLIAHEERIFQELGAMELGELHQNLAALMESGPSMDEGAIRDPYAWDPEVLSGDMGDMAPAEVFNQARSALRVANASGRTLQTNAEVRTDWGRAATRGLTQLRRLAEEGQWASSDAYTNIFNDAFFSNLDKIRTVDPAMYESIRNKAATVLARTGASLNERVASMTAGTPYLLNLETGELTITEETIRENMNEQRANILMDAITEAYGGDVQAALDDNGRAFNIPSYQQAQVVWERLTSARGRIPANVQEMSAALATSLRLQRRLAGMQEQNQSKASILTFMDRHEGAGNYNTLYDHSQKPGREFEGVVVTNMTIGQLLQFADPSGAYGQFVKKNDPNGKVSTPMGRYQFVGSTMRQLAGEMGLSLDTRFTPQVQDAMFDFYIRKRLARANTMQGKIRELRDAWAGFKRVDDQDLADAIAQFEGTDPIQLTDVQFGPAESGSVLAVPSSRRPLARPESLTDGDSDLSIGGTPPDTSVRPEPRPTEDTTEATQTTEEATEARRASGEAVNTEQRERMLAALREFDAADREGLASFTSEEEVQAAIESGELKPGDSFLYKGSMMRVPV